MLYFSGKGSAFVCICSCWSRQEGFYSDAVHISRSDTVILVNALKSDRVLKQINTFTEALSNSCEHTLHTTPR